MTGRSSQEEVSQIKMSLRRRFDRKRSHRYRSLSEGGLTGRSSQEEVSQIKMSIRRRFDRKRSHRYRSLSEGGFTGRSLSGRGLTDKDVSHR